MKKQNQNRTYRNEKFLKKATVNRQDEQLLKT